MEYLQAGERLDDLQLDGLHIIQRPGKFLFGTDSVLLANMVKSCKRGLDLGTGCGVLPLLLYGHCHPQYICGMELQPDMADMACRSVRLNGLEACIEIIHADYAIRGNIPHAGSYDTVLANPPYETVGSGDMRTGQESARKELDSTLEDVARAASHALKQGGGLYMVHRPQRLADIFAAMAAHRLQPKLLQAVQPKEGRQPRMVLIKAVKDGKSGLEMLPPLIIGDSSGL